MDGRRRKTVHADAAAGGTSEGRQPLVDVHGVHVRDAHVAIVRRPHVRAIGHANRAYEVFRRHRGTPPVAVYDPNSFEDGARGPLESDAERGMERGEQEPRNALICICINDLQDIHIGYRECAGSKSWCSNASKAHRIRVSTSIHSIQPSV